MITQSTVHHRAFPPSINLPEHPAAAPATISMAAANERAIGALIDFTALPAPNVVARAEDVHVICHHIGQLGEWLAELGGTVVVSPERAGACMWTLRTELAAAGGRLVPVLVHVVVPSGELVSDYLHAAVNR